MRKPRLAVASVVLVAALQFSVPPAHADVPDVTVTPQPAEVTLIPDSSARENLVVFNGGKKRAIVRVKPSPVDDTITVTPRVLTTVVDAGASRTLGFTVKREAEGVTQSTSVPFIVSYRAAAAASSTPFQQFVVTSLVAKDAQTPDLVEAKIEPAVGTINENSPGESQLEIKNLRETPVYIKEFTVRSPRGVRTTFTCPYPRDGEAPKTDVAPGTIQTITNCPNFQIRRLGAQAVPLAFSTEDAVVPGTRTAYVKFTVSLLKKDAASPAGSYKEFPRSLVAPATFTVEVFGENAILNALGVPIFLLIPGAIIVVLLLFAVTTVGPWRKPVKEAIADEGTLNLKSVERTVAIAIFSVGVSLVMALAYPTLTDALWPGYARNYLHAYGFRDFYYVFLYSFGVVLTLWGALWLAYLLKVAFWGAPMTPEPTMPRSAWKFEVYKDAGGHERWRLKAANGETVATSGQDFVSHASAQAAARRVKAHAATAVLDGDK